MHTNRRMDSRLHGNDGKKLPPDVAKKVARPLSAIPALLLPSPPSFCHSHTPSVIPAKAGIYLRMARRGADAH